MRSKSVWTVVIAAQLAVCGKVGPTPVQPDLAQVRIALDSVWAAYGRAAASGDPAQIAAFYPDSVYLIEPDMPTLRDRAALIAIASEAFKAGRYLEARMQPELTEVVGDRVLQFGAYFDRFQPAGQPTTTSYGRFGAVFAQDSTGTWKILRLVVGKDSTVFETAGAR